MFKFEEITHNTELWHESLKNNYEEWGHSFSLESYIEREEGLKKIFKKHGLLHSAFAITEDGHVVAACEVLRRPFYLGKAREQYDSCIASVFVAPSHRRRGLAVDLLKEVVEIFRSSGDQVSLWSDVGTYYERLGFKVPPARISGLQPLQSFVCSAVPDPEPARPACELLGAAQMDQIVGEHTRLVMRTVDALARFDGRVGATLPVAGLYEQLQYRALKAAESLGIQEPRAFGARSADGHGWISWTYMFGSGKMLVLGVYGSVNDIATLLQTAVQCASQYDLQVELYETSILGPEIDVEEIIAALEALHVKFIHGLRKSSWPMNHSDATWLIPGGYAWY